MAPIVSSLLGTTARKEKVVVIVLKSSMHHVGLIGCAGRRLRFGFGLGLGFGFGFRLRLGFCLSFGFGLCLAPWLFLLVVLITLAVVLLCLLLLLFLLVLLILLVFLRFLALLRFGAARLPNGPGNERRFRRAPASSSSSVLISAPCFGLCLRRCLGLVMVLLLASPKLQVQVVSSHQTIRNH